MSIRTDIINTLRSSACSGISFTLGPIRIHGSDYGAIAHKISSHRIQIVQTTTELPANKARYYYDHATMMVGPGNSVSASLIVHEATHAIQDMQGKRRGVHESEMAAYVAQAIFIMLTSSRFRAPTHEAAVRSARRTWPACLFDPDRCKEAIGNAAAAVADSILSGTPILKDDVDQLLAVIQMTPDYAGRRGPVNFDGLHNDRHFTHAQLKKHHAAVIH